MAKEYIERNALIAEYDRVHEGAPGGARKLMVDAPTADVVEVVRCKDCVLHKEGCLLDTHPYMTADNGYCYLGKRTPKERGGDQ